MALRLGIAVAICFYLATAASAQVVRFETTMGDFDMVLNPTHNTKLQGYVDNFLNYINSDRYLGSWINRADSGFVLQMGGFFSETKRPPLTKNSTVPVAAFSPVTGVPASTIGLSNTVATVSLALSNNNANSGTSSFFVNLNDNGALDLDPDPNQFLPFDSVFTVFAQIPDMTVISKIADLKTVDLATNAAFGAGNDNITFSNVPLQADGKDVFIKRAFVVSETSTVVTATSPAQQLSALSASGTSGGLTAPISIADLTMPAGAAAAASGLTVNNVPEPSSFIMALFGAMTSRFCARRRRQ
jgi:cyclophilin family peptidyl-prolyl cis-trans isomerase